MPDDIRGKMVRCQHCQTQFRVPEPRKRPVPATDDPKSDVALATQALQDTMDALRGTDDETVRLAASQVLFGDLANTQADAAQWAAAGPSAVNGAYVAASPKTSPHRPNGLFEVTIRDARS